MRTSTGGAGLDVTFYDINVVVGSQRGFLSGYAETSARVTTPSMMTARLDLSAAMTLDSAHVDGIMVPATQEGDEINFPLPRSYGAGETIRLKAYYHGFPATTGFGSYTDSLRANNDRWIFSLSEPYGSRDWWPCVNMQSDKADSFDITITCPAGYQGIAPGRLVSTVANGDGSTTWHWAHRYPISSYLISMNVGKYDIFTDWFRYGPTDSMEVTNYVLGDIASRYPEYRTNAAKVPRMLEVYSGLFGMYPFVNERYGQIEFGWNGGMEHQTLTSLGVIAFNEGTIAHELAHQWFGDMITCRTWAELWLNEGFATFCEAYYRGIEYGDVYYQNIMQARAGSAKLAQGTLRVQDTLNGLFAASRVYYKGAWVLHMLRNVLGDSLFFASMKAYATNPALRFATASTEDFRAACEATTGQDLGFFFDEWVDGERYPAYTYSMSQVPASSGDSVVVTILQSTGTLNPAFFTMPVQLQFTGPALDTTVTIWNDAATQSFGFLFPSPPKTLRLDPGNHILKNGSFVSEVSGHPADMPSPLVLSQNYPNPFNPSTVIRFGLQQRSLVRVELFDMLGRKAATVFIGAAGPGWVDVPWASSLPSGTYVCRVQASPVNDPAKISVESRKMMVLR